MEKHVEMLRMAMEIGELVEMYSDASDTDRFCAGYVLAMDEASVIQRHIHPSGSEDGYSWRAAGKIYRVNRCTRYLECLKKLMEPEKSPLFVPVGDEPLCEQLLRFAMKHEMVVQIELCDSDTWNLTGFVREIGDGLTVEMLNVEGEADGIAAIRLEDITEISCGDEHAAKIGRLYRLNRGKE